MLKTTIATETVYLKAIFILPALDCLVLYWDGEQTDVAI